MVPSFLGIGNHGSGISKTAVAKGRGHLLDLISNYSSAGGLALELLEERSSRKGVLAENFMPGYKIAPTHLCTSLCAARLFSALGVGGGLSRPIGVSADPGFPVSTHL